VKSAKEIQERCEAPVWDVGDKWIYKSAEGGLRIRQTLDIKEDLFIMKISESQNLRAYDKKTMNLKFLVEKSGKKVKEFMNTLTPPSLPDNIASR
jgi:hypothetical protein